MTLLKKWSDERFNVAGETVTLKLKILPGYGAGTTFSRRLAEFRVKRLTALAAIEKNGNKADTAATAEAMTAMPDQDFARQVFADWVRVPAPGIDVEREDGDGVTHADTGGALFDALPTSGLILGVLTRLSELQQLGEVPGKGSGSPSTSSLEKAASSASPAPSTESAASPTS